MKDAALAIEAAQMHIATAVAPTNVFKLSMFFHLSGDVFTKRNERCCQPIRWLSIPEQAPLARRLPSIGVINPFYGVRLSRNYHGTRCGEAQRHHGATAGQRLVGCSDRAGSWAGS